MTSLLLHVGDDPHFESRLQGALDLARFLDGHVELLQTRRVPAFVGSDAAGFAGSAALVAQLMDDEARLADAARTRLAERLKGEDVPFSFTEAMGDAGAALVDRSLLADTVVLTLPPEGERELSHTLSEVVTRADAPVLAVPGDARRLELEKPMLVAWKASPEAAHAVKRAVPMLKRASRVDIVAVDAPGPGDLPSLAVASYLARHGVKAELHERSSGGHATADTILTTAQELGSGLVVMGGYGRSRAMEYLLGGVTRRLLASAEVALVMAH
jgi:nucleotide-binding universal stress UspA family protein